MKEYFFPSILPIASRHALLVTLTLSAAHALEWDSTGSGTGASDGGGNWNAGNVWYNGIDSLGWVDGSPAIFGAGGVPGTIDLQGGNFNVSGMQFRDVNLADTNPAYTLSNGTITIANGGTISIASTATGPDPLDRLKFNTVLAGTNITISNTTAAVFLQLLAANTWTGNLTLDAGPGGQFVEVRNTSAISSLDKVTVENGITLALNAGGTFNGPEIEIQGTGSSSRGALRIDTNTTVQSNITLADNARIGTINSNVVTSITGNITGARQLDQNAGGTTAVGTIIYSGTNDINELRITKGNAQIGAAAVGSLTADVTVNGDSAILSGTGTITGNLNVTTGVLKPGDRGSESGIAAAGTSTGILTVNGDVAFNPAAAATMAEFQMGAIFSDQLAIDGSLTLNGQTTILGLFATDYTPTATDTWDLITFTGLLTEAGFDIGTNLRTGADADANEGNLNLPDVSADGLAWEVALTDGALTVTLVPEPSGALLFGASGTLLALRRRKKSGNIR